jgi:two-component system sensor histidine kinase/response regulator
MQLSKEDEDFMKKVLEIIDGNIADDKFNVERLADLLSMSRSNLLRKIKTLFNLSPVDFIRLIRLKKAAQLIQEGEFRIAEVGYMVGFSSPSYFTRMFVKQFGMAPKEFEKQVRQLRKQG